MIEITLRVQNVIRVLEFLWFVALIGDSLTDETFVDNHFLHYLFKLLELIVFFGMLFVTLIWVK